MAEAVEELFLRPESATMNRAAPLLGNNGSCADYYQFYCCVGTLPHRVLQQPQPIADIEWSLSTLREKLVKVGAKVVRHGRYVTFQLAKVAVPRELFRKILSLIDDLRRRPVPA